MKYWDELTAVERTLIDLDTVMSFVRALSLSVESGTERSDIQNCIYLLEEKLETIVNNGNRNFQNLWEVVRNDTFIEIESQITDETIEEMNKVINSWVNK